MGATLHLLCFTALLLPAKMSELPFGYICLIYLLGLGILFVEMFVPGGMLGVIGTTIVVGSVVLAFWQHADKPMYGISLLVVSLVVLPAMGIWLLRRITLVASQNLEDGYTSVSETLEELVGQEGVVLTPLRPSGMAKIGNHRVDVTAENVMLDANTPVRVVKIEGNSVVVKAIGEAPRQED